MTEQTDQGTEVEVTSDTNFRKDLDRIIAGLDAVTVAYGKINAALEELESAARNDKQVTLASLGVAYFQLKDRYEVLDKLGKKTYHLSDFLNKSILPNRMRELDTDGFRVPEIARSFSIVEKTSATFLDKDEGLKWLREIGQGDMIQETVNAQTLSTFCRNMLLELGKDPPEEIVKMNVYNTTSMTKYRPK